MSNPAINVLIDIIIANERLIIEDNLGEAIHIHYGNVRLSVSIMEFNHIVHAIAETAETILSEVGLDFFNIDATAFLWGWTDSIMQIQSTEIKMIKLGDLRSTRTYGAIFGMSGIQIPAELSQSRIVKALKNNDKDLRNYGQINYKGIDNKERLNIVKKSIESKGYPYNNQYIIVDQNCKIYDGDHRAGCLFKIYGKDYTIPVIMFNGGRKLSSDDIKTSIKKLKRQYNKKILVSFRKKIGIKIKSNRKYRDEKKGKGEVTSIPSWEELVQYLEGEHVKYFTIEGFLIEPQYRKEINRVLAVEPDSFSKVLTYLDQISMRIDKLNKKKIETIYSLERPRFFHLRNGKIALCDKLYCNSFYWNVILPLDHSIQEFAWKTVYFSEKNMRMMTGKEVEYIFFLVRYIMGKWMLGREEKEYLDKNVGFLEEEKVLECMEKEFFGFTEKLTELLKKKKYEDILEEFVRFKEY